MHKFKRASKLKTRILPDGCVAVFSSPRDPDCTLPPIGALAWELFDGEHSTEDVVTEVAKLIGCEETSELRQQILDLANELRHNGFLEDC